ncbi:MAG: VWA domain-containing protein [Phycisphaerae bacterium]|nr:VWA domain-containing protein [Phycisphaerae bacterium]
MTPTHLPLSPDWLWWPFPWVWALLLLLLVPALLLLWRHPRRRSVIRFSSLHAVRTAGGTPRRHLRLILPILRTAALVCLIVAAARPQTPNESRRVLVEGIAIQMVLDISTSMNDLDLSPRSQRWTRLDVVKDVFRRFVVGDDNLPGRPNDLIGMIRFARYADSVCPLTLDRDALLDVLDDTHLIWWVDSSGRLRGNRDEDGTAIGDALALAVERLKDLKRTTGSGDQLIITSRAVILLSDGENNQGMITPTQAGELAATFGIKVYTILAGTGEHVGWGRRRPVNDRELRHIAEVTGGKHYRARDRAALEEIYAEIDRLERTKTEEHRFVEWGELAWPWLMAAFVCLGMQTLLDATLLRKIP